MTEPVISSAVVLPEPLEASPPPLQESLKRRQSSHSDSGSKRPRLSTDTESLVSRQVDTNSPTSASPRGDRRANGYEEERKRGKRLFGNLLGTLSQSTTSTVLKRRVDIEKKQQAKLRLQDTEQAEQKKIQYEELMVRRRQEQIKYDEQVMRTRHANMVNTARFLKTKAEPHLYYKPWNTSVEEEDRIEAQVKEAEAVVNQELREFEAQELLRAGGQPETQENSAAIDVQNPERQTAPSTAIADPTDHTLPQTTDPPDIHQTGAQDEATDDHDDPVVEGGEDPVIY